MGATAGILAAKEPVNFEFVAFYSSWSALGVERSLERYVPVDTRGADGSVRVNFAPADAAGGAALFGLELETLVDCVARLGLAGDADAAVLARAAKAFRREALFVVSAVAAASPAAAQGVERDWFLTPVDGVSVRSVASILAAVEARGPPATPHVFSEPTESNANGECTHVPISAMKHLAVDSAMRAAALGGAAPQDTHAPARLCLVILALLCEDRLPLRLAVVFAALDRRHEGTLSRDRGEVRGAVELLGKVLRYMSFLRAAPNAAAAGALAMALCDKGEAAGSDVVRRAGGAAAVNYHRAVAFALEKQRTAMDGRVAAVASAATIARLVADVEVTYEDIHWLRLEFAEAADRRNSGGMYITLDRLRVMLLARFPALGIAVDFDLTMDLAWRFAQAARTTAADADAGEARKGGMRRSQLAEILSQALRIESTVPPAAVASDAATPRAATQDGSPRPETTDALGEPLNAAARLEAATDMLVAKHWAFPAASKQAQLEADRLEAHASSIWSVFAVYCTARGLTAAADPADADADTARAPGPGELRSASGCIVDVTNAAGLVTLARRLQAEIIVRLAAFLREVLYKNREWERTFAAKFEEMDINGDGSVNQAEILAFAHMNREHFQLLLGTGGRDYAGLVKGKRA
ncbi:hypothetical protein M885DRAFT_576955 [Pelagophyceae sp. CCMP2097]|nr:hypothetical protein M885DRAFT_576955 [Pelagophyceae sp. CCMP2097]